MALNVRAVANRAGGAQVLVLGRSFVAVFSLDRSSPRWRLPGAEAIVSRHPPQRRPPDLLDVHSPMNEAGSAMERFEGTNSLVHVGTPKSMTSAAQPR